MAYGADLNFTFAQTPKVVFGANTVSELGTLARELGFQRAFVVTDPFLAEQTPIFERVRKALGTRLAGAFTQVVADPTAASIDNAAKVAAEAEADLLVSVGGGSAIDTAKGMALVLREGGPVLSHEGYHALDRPQLPHIAIPTTAGTGSEMTMVTVIKDPERGQKTFIGSYYLHPVLAILDPTLTVSLPARLTAATGMDAMSHAVESLFSTLGQPLSDAGAIEAIRLITHNLPLCLYRPADLAARGQMLIAASLAGTAFSNAMVSLNHAMAHALGARHGIHHGTANAILLPHTMRHFADVSAEPLSRVAQAMGLDCAGKSAAQAAVLAADRMEKLLAEIGLTDRLRDYQIGEADLAGIAELATGDGSIIYSPRPVEDHAEIIGLLRLAL